MAVVEPPPEAAVETPAQPAEDVAEVAEPSEAQVLPEAAVPLPPPTPPEAPPPPPAAPPTPPRPTWPLPLAEGPASRYLHYLPGIYQESEFLGRFLLIMESIWEPLERRQDFVDMYFDPRTSPREFVFWLAGWLGLALDTHWPEERCRRLLTEAMDLYRWRGTRYGLARMIEVCTGLEPEVVDLSDGAPDAAARPFVFRVRLAIPSGSDVDGRLVETLIRAHKPAHAGYVLEIR
jgi:phage tail-like protein